MHVHVKTETDLRWFLRWGVTTVRNMNGEPKHLLWRDQIASRTLLGPEISNSRPLHRRAVLLRGRWNR
ncbi:MAG: hypothetical protein R2856_12525 [Caldilineaceae bacterium]